MKLEEIIDKINAFLVEEFEARPDAITPDGNMKDVLGLDSLDLVDLVVIVEKNFGFKIQGEDFIKMKTFNDFYLYIFDRVNHQPV